MVIIGNVKKKGQSDPTQSRRGGDSDNLPHRTIFTLASPATRAATRALTTPRPPLRPRSSWPATTNNTCDSAIDRDSTYSDKSRANTASCRRRTGVRAQQARRARRDDAGGGGCPGGGPCVGARVPETRALVCTCGSTLGVRSRTVRRGQCRKARGVAKGKIIR